MLNFITDIARLFMVFMSALVYTITAVLSILVWMILRKTNMRYNWMIVIEKKLDDFSLNCLRYEFTLGSRVISDDDKETTMKTLKMYYNYVLDMVIYRRRIMDSAKRG